MRVEIDWLHIEGVIRKAIHGRHVDRHDERQLVIAYDSNPGKYMKIRARLKAEAASSINPLAKQPEPESTDE